MRSVTIGDLGTIFDGPHATPTRRDHGPYFLNIASLNQGRLDLSQSDHVDQDDFVNWTRRVTPQEGDLLFSYETRLGEAAMMPPGVLACLGRRMALLRPDREVIEPRYLLYRYLSPDLEELIRANAIHGATVDRIALSTMGEWSLQIHDLPTQRAIAEVLGALDDKMAANMRLVNTLQLLTDALSRQLMLNAKPSAGVTVGDIADIVNGLSYRSSDLKEGSGDSLVTLKSVTREGNYAERGLKGFCGDFKPEQRVEAGEVVVAQTDLTQAAEVVGRAVRLPKGGLGSGNAVASLDLAIVRPKRGLPTEFLLAVLRSEQFRQHCLAHTSGTTVLHLRRGAIASYPMPAIDTAANRDFAGRTRSLYDRQDSAAVESRALAALRDALLPELMSGRLRVKDAEKTVEEVV